MERTPLDADELRTIERARQGDVRAFEELYRLHVGRVHAACLRLLGDRERAEEATQDVFLRLWTRIDTFRGECAFSSWLHRLAVNRVLDLLRSERRRREGPADEAEELSDRPGRDEAPATRFSLERAIASLPERARLVFVLHDIEGYRHEEIAAMMGTMSGTSKAQLHRARHLLRRLLG